MKNYFAIAATMLLGCYTMPVCAEETQDLGSTYGGKDEIWNNTIPLDFDNTVSGTIPLSGVVIYCVTVPGEEILTWNIHSDQNLDYEMFDEEPGMYFDGWSNQYGDFSYSQYASAGKIWMALSPHDISGNPQTYTISASFEELPNELLTIDSFKRIEFGRTYHGLFTIGNHAYEVKAELPLKKDSYSPVPGSIKITVSLDNASPFEFRTDLGSSDGLIVSNTEFTINSDGLFEYTYRVPENKESTYLYLSLVPEGEGYGRNYTYGPFTIKADFIPDNPSDLLDVSNTSTNVVNTVSGYVWEKDGNNWRLLKDGEFVTNDWAKVNGSWYWINADGTMKTGWLQQGDDWYFLKSSGSMAASEWVTNNGYWYYVTSSGRMASSRWIQKPGTTDWYYVGASGQMLANRWMTLNGKSYYLKADGKMAANEYIQGYYVNANGEWVS